VEVEVEYDARMVMLVLVIVDGAVFVVMLAVETVLVVTVVSGQRKPPKYVALSSRSFFCDNASL
jgi:hypothetical protein